MTENGKGSQLTALQGARERRATDAWLRAGLYDEDEDLSDGDAREMAPLDPRLAWLMGKDRNLSFSEFIDSMQLVGNAEPSYVIYTDRIAPIYALSDPQKAAVLDAIIEEMLIHKHRALSPDLEAIVSPIGMQMRRDAMKYRIRCEQNHRRRLEREAKRQESGGGDAKWRHD